ncbi:MAG: carbamoyltransferase N-terminal domain-containing protein, partial [Cyanobacteria bacterium J06648_11]
MPYALGIICYGWHEAAAVLVQDGAVIAAAEEERFSRQKFDPSFPEQAIAFCLDRAGISPKDLCAIGYGFDPRRRLVAKALHLARYFPASVQLVTKRGTLLQRMNQIEPELRDRLDFTGKIYRLNHHLCHAASTFFASPFDRAAILTLDGAGDWESGWWGVGDGTSIEQTAAIDWPQSLGHLYAAFTEYLGFKPFADEYKVMGLAPYGEANYRDRVADILRPTPTGYHLNLDYF